MAAKKLTNTSTSFVDPGRAGAKTGRAPGWHPAPTHPAHGAGIVNEPVRVGWVKIRAVDDERLTVLCELEGFPVPTDGYGGAEVTDRPGRVGLTSWTGFRPIEMDLNLVLDGVEDDRTVEPACEILEALAGRGGRRSGLNAGPPGEPPKVVVDAGGVSDWLDGERERWWVNDLDWSTDDDEVMTNSDGERILATVTVTLLQAVEDTRLEDRALIARRQIQARKPARRRYRVKRGESLITIARDQLGDAGRWEELARLNDIRDPRAVKPDALIRLP